MDDTDLVRPPRHTRKPTSRRAPARRATRGQASKDGPKDVCVKGRLTCGCGAAIAVNVKGQPGSIAVQAAEMTLAMKKPMCAKCVEREDEERERAEAEALATAKHARRVELAGVPARWRELRFDQIERDGDRADALEACEAWAAGKLRGVTLWGEVGRGKTVMAAAAAVQRARISRVRWLSVAELLLDLRMPFHAPEYARGMRALKVAPNTALVLDDLDKLKPSENALQPLYVAVNGWIEAALPLLITSNRHPEELAEWMGETFGEPIASRIGGYGKVVQVGGRDRRMS